MAKKEQETEKGAKGTDVQKKDKNKKPNIFVRMGRKLKETFSELKRVTWPTFGDALKSTGIVIVIVLIFLLIMTAELLDLLTRLGGN